ncbi:malonyl-CoA decarboxylase [Anaplasmataceae bacterium AB001_6]|nr:malonyl-CoA decarboxylase [Anaplasmataceae bacterium AB001_6]
MVGILFDKAIGLLSKFGSVVRISSENQNGDCDLGDKEIKSLHGQINDITSNKFDESYAKKKIIAIGNLYNSLTNIGKFKILNLLDKNFGIDSGKLQTLINMIKNTDDIDVLFVQKEISRILDYPRKNILKGFVSLENGMLFLVKMRSEVLYLIKSGKNLNNIESDLRDILKEWFYVGLLELKMINWHSSASLLEKLINYEAVHRIQSWSDLKNRLDSDRRCYAFFHRHIPNEPLIFVEIALTNKIHDNISHLLDETAPLQEDKEFSHAIFYSISNTQKGLIGINMGNFLIKQVVDEISVNVPTVKYFFTLSPIPGFSKWLKNYLENKKWIFKFNKDIIKSVIFSDIKSDNYLESLDFIKQELISLCAYYLLRVKKNFRDPVAHFHFSNGAGLNAINWKADISLKGLEQSFGLMVNYHYEIKKINSRYEEYFNRSKIYYSSSINNLVTNIKK